MERDLQIWFHGVSYAALERVSNSMVSELSFGEVAILKG